jgi:hypothetical protein
MNVNHKLAHIHIAALSCTKEGRELVQALEDVRYYHSEGRIAQLGHDSMLVTAVDAYDDEEVKGIVLLPGKKDRLTYQTADWCDDTIKGALFWKDYHSYPVLIPYVLGEWAVQCIVEHSEYEPVPIQYTKPVLSRVDTLPEMYVHMPKCLQLTGLTADKYTKRKATQSHYTQWSWDAPEMPGYSEDCPIVYNKTAEDVVHAARCAVGDSYYDYNPTTEKLMSPYHWPHIPEDEARAACQVLSDYKAWAYFDSCSYEQLIRHLQKRIFKGADV